MRIGPALRRLMSPSLERRAAGIYRGIFVDLSKVAQCLAEQVPINGHLLDVGGGDGELLNELLALRPDICVTMVDVAGSVGRFIERRYHQAVARYPNTTLETHLEGHVDRYSAVLVSDVIHHLPLPYRPVFLKHLHSALQPGGTIFLKDIEPGYFLSSLSLFCDKHISGDPGVVLLSQAGLRAMATEALPDHTSSELGLFQIDRPNYLMSLRFAGVGSVAGQA